MNTFYNDLDNYIDLTIRKYTDGAGVYDCNNEDLSGTYYELLTALSEHIELMINDINGVEG